MTGPGWRLRPAGLEDLSTIVEIIRAEDLACRGRSEADVAVRTERIAADPDFDVARDQVVAECDGEVLAAAIVTGRGANIAVHPDHDHAALRRDLLGWAERRQAERGLDVYRVVFPAANTSAARSLQRAGYRLERFYAEMVRDFALTGAPEVAVTPTGYRLRRIDPRADREALHALDDRAFRDRPDYQPETLEQYDRAHLSFSWFAPAWSVMIETDAGEAVGSLIGFRPPARPGGYVAVLGVDPDHRRRGLARALLLAAFGSIHAAGLPRVELHVAGDNPGALDLYTSVGMSPGERLEHYVRTP